MTKGNPTRTGEKLNRIKEILAAQGRSQIWLATELGRDKNTIASMCNNITQPHLKDLKKIAELLNVTTKDLLPGISRLDFEDFLGFVQKNYKLQEGYYFPINEEAKNFISGGNHVPLTDIIKAYEKGSDNTH
jgi:transcriptional regulator with XRE-family HTH domain